MRAIYLATLDASVGHVFEVEGEKFNHLKVVRIKINEEVLVLNGKGLKCFCKVLSLGKKSLQLQILSFERLERPKFSIHLFLAIPKKDAFEDCVRYATELGVEKIIPVITRYSQFEQSHFKRTEKIIEASLIQSNNPFFLELSTPVAFHEALELSSVYPHRYAFSSMSRTGEINKTQSTESPIALWIGPEAGFEAKEELSLRSVMSEVIQIEGPIMTSPTALAAAVGYIKGQLKRN